MAKSLKHAESSSYVTLLRRFAGYLSGDSLNYLLGFAIYAWLVRILSNQDFGFLGVTTSVYQIFMMVVALGIDLVGPRLIAEHSGFAKSVIRRIELLRIKVAVTLCLPAMLLVAFWYYRPGNSQVAILIVASFSMVIARALDLTYVAVAFSSPGALAKSRVAGLSLYLLSLILGRQLLVSHLWAIPVLNAIAVTIGRIDLKRRMHEFLPRESSNGDLNLKEVEVLRRGAATTAGQLFLLAIQSADVIILSRYLHSDVVGQYAIVSRLYMFGTAVLTSIVSASFPDVIGAIEISDRLRASVGRLFALSCLLGVVGSATLITLGPFVIEAFAHRRLDEIRVFCPVFALAYLAMAIANPILSLLPSLRCEREYLLGISASAVLIVIGDLYFVPRFGAVSAAYCLAAVTFLLATFSAAIFLRHLATLSHGFEIEPSGASR